MTGLKNVRIVIADDEKTIAEELRSLLLEIYPDVKIAGVAYNGQEALDLTLRHKPDIVFLDIQMPLLTGMEVAAKLIARQEPPQIVFSTAYDEYALEAFSLNAMDYILKPYDEKDIERVMKKFEKMITKSSVTLTRDNESPSATSYSRKFSVDKGDRIGVVDSDKIKLAYAKDRLVYIKMIDDTVYRTRLTLQELESKLPPDKFFRCHRNYIVNVNQIKEIATWFNKGYILILENPENSHGLEIPVGRVYAARLKEYIEL